MHLVRGRSRCVMIGSSQIMFRRPGLQYCVGLTTLGGREIDGLL